MKKKVGAIDPKIKAEIDEIHEHLKPYLGAKSRCQMWHWYWYFRIDQLAKRI